MNVLNLLDFNLELDQILPQLQAKIDQGLQLAETCSQLAHPNFDTLVVPLSNFISDLNEFWTPVSHLHNVANSRELRAVYERGALKLNEFYTTLAQHQGLYQVYFKLQASPEFTKLTPPEQKIIQDALLEFELSGVGLPEHTRAAFKACEQKLVEATTKFEQNLMDAINAWHYDSQHQEEVAGIPEPVLTQSAERALTQNQAGYRFGIDAPTYLAVMGNAVNPQLREHFYHAYVTRASEFTPDFDNSKIMTQILQLRQEEAQLLEYPNFASYALVKKMAKTPEKVLEFLYDLAQRSRAKGEQDLEELRTFADRYGHRGELQAFDLPFYSERLKEESLGFGEEALRPYFPLTQVLKGLLTLVSTLFGIRFQDKNIATWDPKVRFLEVYELASDTLIGGIYVDLYVRPNKRSGAWMDEGRALRFLADGQKQLPLAFLNTNFLPPANDADAYLTHDDVLTLFHELGHVLQYLLTEIPYPEIGGIHGISWDAVELPSQFMENFAYEPEILTAISQHRQSGNSLSPDLIAAIGNSRKFQSGLLMLRQLEFALFDMKLHLLPKLDHAAEIQSLLDEVRQEIAVVIPPAFNRFQHSFSHIFAGSYAAGYYSYKWAEVLSSDAFSRFEAEGILNPKTGQAFRSTILAEGGSREALDIFIDFRGRPPKIDPLLRHNGILTKE